MDTVKKEGKWSSSSASVYWVWRQSSSVGSPSSAGQTVTEWPPKAGELWLAAERYPATGLNPEIPGGSWVTILAGRTVFLLAAGVNYWWRGEVLGPYGISSIKAVPGDLIPGTDPRLVAPEFTRAA